MATGNGIRAVGWYAHPLSPRMYTSSLKSLDPGMVGLPRPVHPGSVDYTRRTKGDVHTLEGYPPGAANTVCPQGSSADEPDWLQKVFAAPVLPSAWVAPAPVLLEVDVRKGPDVAEPPPPRATKKTYTYM